MQYTGDLSFIRSQKDFAEMIRRFPKHLFDAIKFPLQDFRNAGKDENVFDRDDRKPHTLSTDEPRAFRNVRHSQVPFDQRFAVIAP